MNVYLNDFDWICDYSLYKYLSATVRNKERKKKQWASTTKERC